jgi:long-chain acyl-CoA synthetase
VTGVIRVCDELPVGEVGTFYFERKWTPFDHHNDSEKTQYSRHPINDTWCAIGDMTRAGDDGFLYITGRKAFMVISGGGTSTPPRSRALW